jgi:hypothetical protein
MLHTLLDYALHLDTHLGSFIQSVGAWSYLVIFLVTFAETGIVLAPMLPGDSMLFATGDTTSDAIVTPEPAVAGKRVVQINLAWLILAIPCGILLVAVRFAFLRIKQRLVSTAS